MHGILDFLQLTSFRPGDLLVVLSLVVLEGLLSCDNAVALAVVVRRLPPEQQGRALRYGIGGAYAFLFIALLAATWIVKQWYLKFFGGAYLLWMAVSHFRRHEPEEGQAVTPARRIPGCSLFWSTVISVELTDIAFSVDSIAAAVALSDKLWVLLLGGMLCILMMRFAAQGFVILLRKFPHLETAAFLAVALIGLKLILEFPLDVVGREQPFIPGTTYATAADYQQQIASQHPPLLALPHMLTINSSAGPPPEATRFTDPVEFRGAQQFWLLHGRQFIHLDDWGSAALILTLFGLGFLKRAPRAAGNS